MIKEQSGQALAGVMVVMLIVFALAGAVAVAASALLARQGGSRNAFTENFTAQSAATDALAQVAGSTNRCSAPPLPPAALPIVFPRPDPALGSDSQTATCSRVDNVATSPPDYLAFDWGTAPKARCSTTVLPSSTSGKKIYVLFNARSTTGGWAYVDATQSDQGCPLSLPSTTPPQCPSSSSGPVATSNCTPCKQPRFQPLGQSLVAQVALQCDLMALPGGSQAYLHLRNTVQSPTRGFLGLRLDQGGGSLYLIAAATNLGPSRDYEEALMYVGSGTSQLRYEAPLP